MEELQLIENDDEVHTPSAETVLAEADKRASGGNFTEALEVLTAINYKDPTANAEPLTVADKKPLDFQPLSMLAERTAATQALLADAARRHKLQAECEACRRK